MRTIRTKVYKFSELSKSAQEKVIENNYDINVDYEDWSKGALENNIQDLEELGFNDVKIYFSGFSSQGDGACFICSSIDFNKFMKGKYKAYADELSCEITHNYRYYFATSTNVELSGDSGDVNDELFADIVADIKNEREKLGNEIYRYLENTYNYLTSEEAIRETIESNEYEFTKEGNRF